MGSESARLETFDGVYPIFGRLPFAIDMNMWPLVQVEFFEIDFVALDPDPRHLSRPYPFGLFVCHFLILRLSPQLPAGRLFHRADNPLAQLLDFFLVDATLWALIGQPVGQ